MQNVIVQPTENLEYHPLCKMLDVMDAQSFAERLKQYQESPALIENDCITIVELEGKRQIVDGRHTHRIAQALGLPINAVVIDGTPDELAAFVKSRNIYRRHSTPAQLAASLAKIIKWQTGEAAKFSDLKNAGISVGTAKRVTDVAAVSEPLLDAVASGEVAAGTAHMATFNLRPAQIEKALESEDKEQSVRAAIDRVNEDAVSDYRENKGKVRTAPAKKPPTLKGKPKTQPCQSVLDPENATKYPTVTTADDGHQTVHDAYGIPVPDGIGDYFNSPSFKNLIENYQAMQAELDSMKTKFTHLVGHSRYLWTPIAEFTRLNDNIGADIDEMVELLKGGLPHVLCPHCKGEKKVNGVHCQPCRGMGWWPMSVALEGDNYRKILKPSK